MSFIKKKFICKRKSGTATKGQLVTKIKKHNQFYFGTLVFYQDFFQNTGFKESNNMSVKKISE